MHSIYYKFIINDSIIFFNKKILFIDFLTCVLGHKLVLS